MTENTLDWKKSCKLQFGAYAQVHEDRNVTNKLGERTQGAIYLVPKGNVQGTYNFSPYGLDKNITHGKFTEVPIPTIVIQPVVAMALSKKQNEGLSF